MQAAGSRRARIEYGRSTDAPAPPGRHARLMLTIATKWVFDFSEGPRDMREQLGGKGAGIAEMTRVLGPDLAPQAHDQHRCLRCIPARRRRPRGAVRGGRGRDRAPGDSSGAPVRRPVGSSTRLGAQRRPLLDARDDGHGPEPRAQRHVGRRSGRGHRQRAFRLGFQPTPRPDGNKRERSGSGVAFSRDEVTGAPEPSGTS